MKGLIRNNFYSMESNMKISFLIALFLSVVALFVKAYRFRPENEMAYERQNTSGHNGPRFRQASCRLKIE